MIFIVRCCTHCPSSRGWLASPRPWATCSSCFRCPKNYCTSKYVILSHERCPTILLIDWLSDRIPSKQTPNTVITVTIFCKQKPSCLLIRLLFVGFDSKTFKPSWHLFPRVTAPRRAAVCWWASRPRERKRFQKRSSPLKANLPGWLGRLRCTRIFASILFFCWMLPTIILCSEYSNTFNLLTSGRQWESQNCGQSDNNGGVAVLLQFLGPSSQILMVPDEPQR